MKMSPSMRPNDVLCIRYKVHNYYCCHFKVNISFFNVIIFSQGDGACAYQCTLFFSFTAQYKIL